MRRHLNFEFVNITKVPFLHEAKVEVSSEENGGKQLVFLLKILDPGSDVIDYITNFVRGAARRSI